MRYYAYVVDGAVIEIIAPMSDAEGNEIPIEQRYHPDFVKDLIDITEVQPRPGQWWTFDGTSFHAPAPA